ncbi:BTAD domain-containing putative transcriptional regulator [Mycobacterium sp.]|uniref:BTAD domain-containing putative transcriptional regulator n=1 Tax=Mycobacterium sp. TaxID=1785 RepID=UPI003BB18657
MSTLQAVELGVLGPLQVRRDGAPVMIPGAKPRAILTMLGLHGGSVVSAETLIELLWGDDLPRTAAKALQTHISLLRRTLGDGFVLTAGTGWTLAESGVDAARYKAAARLGRDAAAAGDTSQAVSRFEEALALWRGIPELPDGRRGTSEKTRWIEGHAALVEDRADALLVTGRAAEIVGELEAAVAEEPLRERRWGQLMLALYRAGRQGDALGAYQRARALLADELGVDPGPDLRRLEAAIVGQDTALEIPAAQDLPSVTRTVTFLLTDIEGSTAAWEADADAMAVALARHDELVEQVVTSRGGRLIKTRGEGDATFSVFERASAAAAAAIELQDGIFHEPWNLQDPMRIRVALHTGEVELRDGDYFGRAVNRAARLRSLAVGGQILCSGAIAELIVDSLPDDVVLADLGMRQLRNLARPEHVFDLRLETAVPPQKPDDAPVERPDLPAVLTGPGPFVGRGRELEGLVSGWQTALAGGTHAVLIAGEPGVGKTRLAGEWSRQAYQLEAIVLYGRCDEDLGAPYQPFAEALRSLMPCLGTSRLRGMRGVEALLPLVPGLTEILPDLASPTRADPETERYALFDAVVAVLEVVSAGAPVVLILDDLHWAAKPTLLLLRHLLRFGDRARVQIVGTYRSTDLDRSHPLAAMLADLHRGAGSGTANRIHLSGLDEDDVTAYVTEAGYNDEELARALASVTGGNPFFLIEALRHVDESGGVWDPTTLPQGVRETVSRRLSRLTAETNTALAAAAVVGSRFALDLVEKVVEQDLVDAFDEASKSGIVIEEPGGRYRFNHAIVRQSLLAELPSVRRLRLHQRIATTLENGPGADDELIAELAHHYFECAWAGNASKAVEYCRRAADQAVARLAYEGAADLYGQALHALDEIDDELPDRDDQVAELMVARCEALLAAGDVASAAGAVSKLQEATVNSPRLAAWATCFDGQLSMLIHPERLDEVETALGLAAQKLAELDDAAGEANAHTVRAACLARLGRIGDGEIALDDALTAARRARDHRRVNAVLAGAPLAALWGPNPVPRAGGRCLDVVRLLRITTDSPAVEATSTRCQAVLEAFRGRAEAARRMIDSARRTVTELGLRHALLEVEQFAGIVELIAAEPTAAEPRFRQAYNGFRRMGLDADTAETAALLGRTCLALDRDTEADELCLESERLAGHALKASIAWRTLRARLLSRRHEHGEARRIAEAAVALAERTDALVDHGDACLTLATVLGAAGNAAGARTAAERAVDLYERKGAAALAERARRVLGEPDLPSVPVPPEPPQVVELDNACIRAGKRLAAAINREAWDEFEQLYAPEVFSESHRKVIGFTHAAGAIVQPENWAHEVSRVLGASGVHLTAHDIAVRGERLALARLLVGTADASPGAPQDEFLQIYGIDEQGRIFLQIFFDLEDMEAAIGELDAAHARFEDEARLRVPRLENAASHSADRYMAHFAARDWDAVAKVLADDLLVDDRRRVVNAGIRHGRDAEIASLQAYADAGITHMTFVVIAARGHRLILARASGAGGDSGEFRNELLGVVEINSHNQVAAVVVFDLEDFEAAIAELDARYLAGEAAAYAHMWSWIMAGHAALNRQELPPITPDCVSIDHRLGTAFASGELVEYLRAGWDLKQTIRNYVEVVHRLSDLGAVWTDVGQGVSDEGFDAEWRTVDIMAVEGDMVNRCEIFDEADLHIALAKFDQLRRPAPRLENAASQAVEGYFAHFAARDWDAFAKVLADDIVIDDRRRAVNAGMRHGRDAEIANMRAAADTGFTYVTSVVIAARGQRLILTRASGRDNGSEEFQSDALGVAEINSDNQISAIVVFDLDDFDSALAELDARYLAGEAAPHAHTWSVISGGHAALSRNQLPPVAPDCVSIDHRRGTSFAPGELTAYFRAGFDLDQNIRSYVEIVHRLSDIGGVCTHAAHGVSKEGFEAEWRGVDLLMVDGDMVNRCEVFREADLDAAIARFDELHPPTLRLENTATRVQERVFSYIAARDWDAVAQITAENVSVDDRRRVVNAGVLHGRDANIESTRATVDVGFTMTVVAALATRGEHLALFRVRVSGRDSETIQNDALNIVEIDAEERIAGNIVFELDDFDAAFAELDARYIAGEGATHAGTWSLIAGAFVTLNRHEFPSATTDVVNLDHRRGPAFAPGEGFEYIRAGWDRDQTLNLYIETAHRVNERGAVFTWTGYGTSHEGFDAEWRGVEIMTVDGGLLSRAEVFDEADLNAALAKFDQLSRPTPRLENVASQTVEQLLAHFAVRDWDAMAELLADDTYTDDRRSVVNAGIRRGRDAEMANWRATGDIWSNVTSAVIATRGNHIALMHFVFSSQDQPITAFNAAACAVIEIYDDNRLAASTVFDVDDIDAAFAELDARYIVGAAAPYRDAWSVIAAGYAALNRYEVPPSAPDYVNIDHRLRATFEAADLPENLRAAWDLTPELKGHVEVVHRLSGLGAVVTHAARGTTQDGLDAEWRAIHFLTLEGGMVNRCEIFFEADLNAALAKFNQLSHPAFRLKSAVGGRLSAHISARDWEALALDFADDYCLDDRRRVVNAGVMHGRDAGVENTRVAAEVGLLANTMSTIIASRGERLTLERFHASGHDHESIQNDALNVVEIDAGERIAAVVMFDLDDIDAALGELDARYLAGEAAPHAHTWSVIARIYAGFNRREPPATTPDSVYIDHRPLQNVGAVDLVAAIRSILDVASDLNVCIEAVHRLSELGAVVTQTLKGTSQEDLDAEWRTIEIFTVEGDLLSRCEAFDETDLDAAVARFEELHPQPPRLENAASRVGDRFLAHYVASEWDAMAEMLADNHFTDDRRRVVGAGVRRGREAQIADFRTLAGLFARTVTLTTVASRGERLVLRRARFSDNAHGPEAFVTESLTIGEIDADERIVAFVTFDVDDIDAAFQELEARYLAAEAAVHSRVWSAIAAGYATLNRHEIPPTTPDWVNVDHRRGIAFASGELAPYIRATFDVAPDITIRIEVVHQLTSLGAVISYSGRGTSQEGFDAVWREAAVFVVDGDLVSRCEMYDEADLDAALARFDELERPTPSFGNAATQAWMHVADAFNRRDMDGLLALASAESRYEDRRKGLRDVVQAPSWRKALGAVFQTAPSSWRMEVEPIAVRGARFSLTRECYRDVDDADRPIAVELLHVVELDDADLMRDIVSFDPDDLDDAVAELTARWIASGEVAYPGLIEAVDRVNATINRHDWDAAATYFDGAAYVNHRQEAHAVDGTIADWLSSMQTTGSLVPNFRVELSEILARCAIGIVGRMALKGTSTDGVAIEIPFVVLILLHGERVTRLEAFAEDQRDVALARLQELNQPV